MKTASAPRGPLVVGTAALLLLVPLITYWPTVFHRYGFRDDYPILREAREEPGKILRVCASQGRILYGWLLEHSARAAGGVDGLVWMRLAGVVGLGLLAAALLLLLLRLGWQLSTAALLAALLTLTPSAQVFASWAMCWPHVLALLLGTAAFALAERGLQPVKGALPRSLWLAGAVLAMGGAALTYQSNSLSYVVLVAAALVVRRQDTWKGSARWLARHLGVMGAGLGVAFAVMQLTFAAHVFSRSPRVRFEAQWASKLSWVLSQALPDALALTVLDGRSSGEAAGFWAMVLTVGGALLAGLLVERRRSGPAGAWRWLVGLVVLPAAAYSISFVAAERWLTYRTLYALTGVCCVFFAASLENLGTLVPRVGRHVALGALLLLVGTGALLARRQTFTLFAVPQARELQLLEEGVAQAARMEHPRIFVVPASQGDTAAPRRYRDEFGSVSIDADWMAKEALHVLMAERLCVDDVGARYQFSAGRSAPEPGRYDVLVDMRRLREARPPHRPGAPPSIAGTPPSAACGAGSCQPPPSAR